MKISEWWVSSYFLYLHSSCSERPPRKPDLRWRLNKKNTRSCSLFFSNVILIAFCSYWSTTTQLTFILLVVCKCEHFVLTFIASKSISSFCFSCFWPSWDLQSRTRDKAASLWLWIFWGFLDGVVLDLKQHDLMNLEKYWNISWKFDFKIFSLLSGILVSCSRRVCHTMLFSH